ncbi:MAG: hypothetical protein ACOVLB_09085 [Candidatus Nanopelagicus sp.]
MILHEFTMGDVEDPYLYAGFPISKWQQTEHGKWVMANVTEQPVFQVTPDPKIFGFRVVITGKLNPEAETFFRLKYQ